MKKVIITLAILISGINVHAVAAKAKIEPVPMEKKASFEVPDKVKPALPKVAPVTKPVYLDNGMVVLSVKQLSSGDLHYNFQTPTTKGQIRKYAGSLENYLEVVKMTALGMLDDGAIEQDASVDLVMKHGKAWHYTYYDVSGQLIGTVMISLQALPTVDL